MLNKRTNGIATMVVVLLSVAVVLVSGCGGGEADQAATTSATEAGAATTTTAAGADGVSTTAPVSVDLRWGTISAGGAWQVVGSAMLEDIMKDNPGIKGSILPSGTSANVAGVHDGTFNIGFTLTDVTAQAVEGVGFFEKTGPIEDLRSIASLYPQASQIIVFEDSGINSIADLKGKKLTPGTAGLSSHLEGMRVLQEYGIDWDKDTSPEYLSFTDAVQNMSDGRLDALMFTAVPFPFAPVLDLASRKGLRFLPIDKNVVDTLVSKYEGVEAFDLPAGTYPGQDTAVPGIAVRAHLFVRDDMPDDVVYAITKSIHENFDRYGDVIAVMKNASVDGLAAETGIPYHPGALKYYKEVGVAQ